MIRQSITARTRIILGVIAVIIMIGSYSFLSHRQHQINPDDRTVPSWGQMWEGLGKTFEANKRSGERWFVVDFTATVTRLAYGVGISVFASILLGMLMGCLPIVEAILFPPLSLCAKIPPTAALAVFFVMVGTGREMYVTLIAFGIIPIMAQSIYLAVRDIPNELINKGYTLGASHFEIVWNVIFKSVLPKIIDSIRLQLGPAVVYLIAAEMVCGDVGFGYRIRLQSRLMHMDVVYPYILLLASFVFAADISLSRLQRILCPWVQDGRSS